MVAETRSLGERFRKKYREQKAVLKCCKADKIHVRLSIQKAGKNKAMRSILYGAFEKRAYALELFKRLTPDAARNQLSNCYFQMLMS